MDRMTSTAKKHGIDLGKLNPVSLFYLPCRPRDPSGAYFKTFANKSRKRLNVEEWVQKLEDDVAEVDRGFVFQPHQRNQLRIDQAIQHWQSTKLRSGVGHAEFWRLAFRLKVFGCDEDEIHSILTEQAELARTPKERQAEIPAIIKDLRRKLVY